MEIKDVIHFYIGQKLERGGTITHALLDAAEKAAFNAYADFKPILRKLSDMTEEEKVALFNFLWPKGLWGITETGMSEVIGHLAETLEVWSDLGERVDVQMGIQSHAKMIQWLLLKGFDLFNLIDSGLAIDNKSL